MLAMLLSMLGSRTPWAADMHVGESSCIWWLATTGMKRVDLGASFKEQKSASGNCVMYPVNGITLSLGFQEKKGGGQLAGAARNLRSHHLSCLVT